MPAQTQIAKGLARAFDRVRGVFGPSGSLKVLSGPQHATTEATYSTGWRFPRDEYDDLPAGKKYRKLSVADPDGSRKAKLIAGTALQIGDLIYKNAVKDESLRLPGVVPVYVFKVYGTGERI